VTLFTTPLPSNFQYMNFLFTAADEER